MLQKISITMLSIDAKCLVELETLLYIFLSLAGLETFYFIIPQ